MCYQADADAALSESDRHWIVSVLEEKFGYSVCLDDRDASPGKGECLRSTARPIDWIPTSLASPQLWPRPCWSALGRVAPCSWCPPPRRPAWAPACSAPSTKPWWSGRLAWSSSRRRRQERRCRVRYPRPCSCCARPGTASPGGEPAPCRPPPPSGSSCVIIYLLRRRSPQWWRCNRAVVFTDQLCGVLCGVRTLHNIVLLFQHIVAFLFQSLSNQLYCHRRSHGIVSRMNKVISAL